MHDATSIKVVMNRYHALAAHAHPLVPYLSLIFSLGHSQVKNKKKK